MNRKPVAMLLTGLLTLTACAPGALAEQVKLPSNFTALNVRSGPGTNYRVVSWVLDGDEIDVLSRGRSWSKIEIERNDKVGYIKNSYIAKDGTDHGDHEGERPAVTDCYDMGTVTGGSVNLRAGAGTGYGVVASLARGTRVKLHATSGNWYYAQTLGGALGYISRTYVSAGASYATTARVNLRETPNGDLIRTLSAGTKVTVLSVSGGWSHVKYGSEKGWLYGKYLK